MQHIWQLGERSHSSYVRGCRCRGEGSCTQLATAYAREHKKATQKELENFDWQGTDAMNGFTELAKTDKALAALLAADLPIGELVELMTRLLGPATMKALAAGEIVGSSPEPEQQEPADTMAAYAQERQRLGIDKLGNGGGRTFGSKTSNVGLFGE